MNPTSENYLSRLGVSGRKWLSQFLINSKIIKWYQMFCRWVLAACRRMLGCTFSSLLDAVGLQATSIMQSAYESVVKSSHDPIPRVPRRNICNMPLQFELRRSVNIKQLYERILDPLARWRFHRDAKLVLLADFVDFAAI
jgi:hypothetical protein